jgi:Ala-tRNA(Pro) deacylase
MKTTIKELLEELAIPYKWVDHEAVYTVAQSLGVLDEKTPVKNLLLQNKAGDYFLIIMPGAERLDMKLLAQKLDTSKLQFASADDLMKLLGVAPGSVSLFGLLHDTNNQVQLVVESSLLEADELGFHPNDNTATIFISPANLGHIAHRLDHTVRSVSLS